MSNRFHISVCLLAMVLMSANVHSQEEDEIAKYQPPRDYGHDWSFAPLFNYTTHEGLLLGGGPRLYEHGFRRIPYVYKMDLVGGFTFKTGAYQFVYTAHLPSLLRKVDLEIHARASQLGVLNFYDFGNATRRIKDLEDVKFYSVNSTEYLFHSSLKYRLGDRVSFGLEARGKHFQLRQRGIRFLTAAKADSIGNDRTIVGLGMSAGIDTRNHALFPNRGILLRLEGWNHFDPSRRGRSFQKVSGDFRLFIGDTLVRDVVLALRLYGEKIHGPFPFHDATFLGGGMSLRGFRLQRFAGDASALASADVRMSVLRLKILVPTEVGILLLADAGRVWYKRDSSGGWHTDTGGGLWLAPLSRDFLLSVSGASSPEGLVIIAGAGFSF